MIGCSNVNRYARKNALQLSLNVVFVVQFEDEVDLLIILKKQNRETWSDAHSGTLTKKNQLNCSNGQRTCYTNNCNFFEDQNDDICEAVSP